LGLLLGAMLALAAELLSRKIRTEDDIIDGLDLHVIASIK
jgi:capsular polysaccharide biosynthesis protein